MRNSEEAIATRQEQAKDKHKDLYFQIKKDIGTPSSNVGVWKVKLYDVSAKSDSHWPM